MKKITLDYIKEGFVTITTTDERWYIKSDKEGKPIYYPSVTWICEYYPKGLPFYKWLAQKGWDESQAIKQAAGDKGSKVHQAIVELIDDKEVKIDSKYYNETTEEPEELTVEEYECLMSFVNWWNINPPLEIIAREVAVFNEEHFYAGTIDLIYKSIGEEIWIIDFKTGQTIWPAWELQISAYKYATHYKNAKIGILQLGYRKNKAKYKFTEIQNKFGLFLNTKAIWAEKCSKIQPLQKDYPLSLSLGITKEE